ncbi:MAG TPA: ATP-binding cassette domain-containing protein [Bacteroidales bacterium]
MVVSIEGVTKKFGKQTALDQVSFNIVESQVTGFLGPNGAGKTTLMKIITGILHPTSGRVLFDGENIGDSPLVIKKKIGYLPEHNPLYENMYIKEYLYFAARFFYTRNDAKQKVNEMIVKTGLTAEQNKQISALSKGYRQRVGLAQALIHDPEVLILDEPTSGLDPNQIIEIRNLIKETGKHRTILLSTHIMQEVEAICDRIVVINKGKVVADNRPKEMKMSKRTNVLELNGAIEKSCFEKIEGIERIEFLDGKWFIESHTDVREPISKMIAEKGLLVLSMQAQENSLEEVFRELTK